MTFCSPATLPDRQHRCESLRFNFPFEAEQLPEIVSTSASKVDSGPLLPVIQAVLPGIQSIERRNMNIGEDEAVRSAVLKTQQRRLLVSGMLSRRPGMQRINVAGCHQEKLSRS